MYTTIELYGSIIFEINGLSLEEIGADSEECSVCQTSPARAGTDGGWRTVFAGWVVHFNPLISIPKLLNYI